MSRSSETRELELSLALLAAVVVFALIGLGFEGNWPKVLRVAVSFVAYAGVLLSWVRRRPSRTRVPFAIFAGAGALSGLVSGVVRPGAPDPRLVAAQVALAAVLLGGVHCLALRGWRRLLPAGTAPAEDRG